MATGSSAFTGGEKPILAPYIISMPLVSKYPEPKPGWEGSKKANCPRCQREVWINDTIKESIRQVNVIAMCEDCALKEKDRQSKS